MKIAYIGTFNPITMGHMLIAETVKNQTGADILFVPVSDGYNKDGLNTTYNLRKEMVHLSIKNNDHFHLNDYENEFYKSNKRQPYTIETLFGLKQQLHEDIGLLIGYDNYETFDQWYLAEEILKNFKVIVYPRDGYEINIAKQRLYDQYKDSFVFIDTDLVTNISSTMIRNNFRDGKSNRYLLDDAVIKFIEQHYFLLNYYFMEGDSNERLFK